MIRPTGHAPKEFSLLWSSQGPQVDTLQPILGGGVYAPLWKTPPQEVKA